MKAEDTEKDIRGLRGLRGFNSFTSYEESSRGGRLVRPLCGRTTLMCAPKRRQTAFPRNLANIYRVVGDNEIRVTHAIE